MKDSIKIFHSFSLKVLQTFIHIISILLFLKSKYRKISQQVSAKKLIILGNGPSLSNRIDEIHSLVKEGNDILGVNMLASTSLYNLLKPNIYILFDPVIFKPTIKDERLNEIIHTLKNDLIFKTQWNINLYIPVFYLQTSFISDVKRNSFINVIPINNVPLSGGFNKLKEIMILNGFGNPIFQNVLITSIYVGIMLKYQQIIVFGADHSWLENIKVLSNNKLTLNDLHFSDDNNDKFILKDADGKPQKLHIFLKQLSIMFEEYHLLNQIAQKNEVKIINKTGHSYIDAFQKSP